MSNTLDSNSWYYLFYGDAATSQDAALALNINNSGSGAIVGNALNATANQNAFQWQVLPMGPPNTYVIRSRSLGNQWSMGTFWQPASNLPGMDTRVRSEHFNSPNVTSNSAQWIIQSTGDGTGLYYLSSVQNGTGFHLDSSTSGIFYLRDASTESFTNGMKWAFSSVSAIDDTQWSYTPTSTFTPATSTPVTSTSVPASNSASTTAASTGFPSQQSQSSSSNNMSMSTGIIISIIAAGVAFMLTVLGIIGLCCRRRKQRRSQKSSPYSGYDSKMELEGRQIYPPQPQPDTRVQFLEQSTSTRQHQTGFYEKPRSPLNEKHPAHRDWENASAAMFGCN